MYIHIINRLCKANLHDASGQMEAEHFFAQIIPLCASKTTANAKLGFSVPSFVIKRSVTVGSTHLV